jgi:putative endonuclease
MKYDYILRSIPYPKQRYVGKSSNLIQRLNAHNRATNGYSAQFKPWKVETYIAFSDPSKADKFERYLKHGSGHAFLRRRLSAE